MATPISNFQPSANLYSSYGYNYGGQSSALTQQPARQVGFGGQSSFQSAIGTGGTAPAGGGAQSLQGIVQALGQLVEQIGALCQKLGGGQVQGGGANANIGTGAKSNVGTGGSYALASGYGANVGTGSNANIGTGAKSNVGTGQGAVGGGGYGAGGYGAVGGTAGGPQGGGSSMPMPTDAQEYASYLAGATNGEGKQDGNMKQNRTLPNTRLGTVADGGMFKAASSRDYAIQFAAQAIGQSGRTASGMSAGAQAFGQMSQDAQTFMQVASVYKGEGKNYDNGKLKGLLEKAGSASAKAPGVGDTDIETLGAVAGAIDRGELSLKDITGTPGAVKDPGDYQKAIQKVTSGEFAREVQAYDAQPIGVGGGTQLAKDAEGGGKAGGAGKAEGAGEAAAAGGAGALGAGGDLASVLQQIVQLLAGLLQQLQALLGGGAAEGGADANIGTGANANIGTGANANIGTGANANIGTGAKAAVGTGQNATVGNSTAIGTGAKSAVGTGQNATVGNSTAVGTGGY